MQHGGCAPEDGPWEGGDGNQDRGAPNGCLVDSYALPTFQRARGVVRVMALPAPSEP